MSVGIDFFAAAIQAIAKVHGNRAVLQSQWDALVAAAGEFERVYKECAPVPDDDDAQDEGKGAKSAAEEDAVRLATANGYRVRRAGR